MRAALDANIFVYALIRDDPAKHALAAEILIRALVIGAVIPVQVVGEFLNVVRRKHPEHFDQARKEAERWHALCPFVDTKSRHIVDGAAFAARHRLQLWDSIIWQVAADAGARIFLSEDMQDGLSLAGMTVLDPFNPANGARLEALLRSEPLA